MHTFDFKSTDKVFFDTFNGIYTKSVETIVYEIQLDNMLIVWHCEHNHIIHISNVRISTISWIKLYQYFFHSTMNKMDYNGKKADIPFKAIGCAWNARRWDWLCFIFCIWISQMSYLKQFEAERVSNIFSFCKIGPGIYNQKSIQL